MLNYVSVAILVAAAIQNSAKYRSEWQDLQFFLSDIEIFEVFVRSF